MKHLFGSDHDNMAPCMQCPDNMREKFSKIIQERNWVNEKECFPTEEVEKREYHTIKEMKKKSSMDTFRKKKGIYEKGPKQQILNAMSPLFVSKMKMVGEYGRGLKLPSYHEARVVFLKKGVDNVKSILDK
ncbi:hypothetical protein QQP08_001805 [Theobroma cacao]|nr:hypothetical protein QQP08_001805 [Theobroma cacao]